MANIISDETIEYVGILAKLELDSEERKMKCVMVMAGKLRLLMHLKEKRTVL